MGPATKGALVEVMKAAAGSANKLQTTPERVTRLTQPLGPVYTVEYQAWTISNASAERDIEHGLELPKQCQLHVQQQLATGRSR